MKTIIQVWTQECVNVQTGQDNLYWGFGDIIRSTIFLHQYCFKKGYHLIVDHQFHPVSEFLIQSEHRYTQLIRDNRQNIPFVPRGEVIPFIESSENQIVFLFASEFCLEKISQDTKQFIKSILTPNSAMTKLIADYREKLPDRYSILHCRLGDSFMNKKDEQVVIQKHVNIVQKHINSKSLLVTDSKDLKKKVKNQGIANILDLKIGHLGYCKDSSIVQDTLVEFFLITGATKIKTYSVYPWISSFVYWISKVYDIPLKSVFGRSPLYFAYRLFWNIQKNIYLLSLSSRFRQ